MYNQPDRRTYLHNTTLIMGIGYLTWLGFCKFIIENSYAKSSNELPHTKAKTCSIVAPLGTAALFFACMCHDKRLISINERRTFEWGHGYRQFKQHHDNRLISINERRTFEWGHGCRQFKQHLLHHHYHPRHNHWRLQLQHHHQQSFFGRLSELPWWSLA